MNAHGGRLAGITKELWSQWQQTRYFWKDSRSQEFEQKYLAELLASVDKTVAVIDQLDKLITKIKKDCASEGE
jgi:thymidylate synthase